MCEKDRIIKREVLHYITQCNKFESYLQADNLNTCLHMDLNPSTRTFVYFFSDYDLPLKKKEEKQVFQHDFTLRYYFLGIEKKKEYNRNKLHFYINTHRISVIFALYLPTRMSKF